MALVPRLRVYHEHPRISMCDCCNAKLVASPWNLPHHATRQDHPRRPLLPLPPPLSQPAQPCLPVVSGIGAPAIFRSFTALLCRLRSRLASSCFRCSSRARPPRRNIFAPRPDRTLSVGVFRTAQQTDRAPCFRFDKSRPAGVLIMRRVLWCPACSLRACRQSALHPDNLTLLYRN